MNEQMLITQGNYGIEISVQFIDTKKRPIDITGKSVNIVFIDPDGIKTEKIAYIIDATTGKVGHLLQLEDTTKAGLYETYWSCHDSQGVVTAQEALYYFVNEKDGGNADDVQIDYSNEEIKILKEDVQALNNTITSLSNSISSIDTKVGNNTELDTIIKDNLVHSINEVKDLVATANSRIDSSNVLISTNTTNIETNSGRLDTFSSALAKKVNAFTGSITIRTITKTAYDALTDAVKNNGTIYFIMEG